MGEKEIYADLLSATEKIFAEMVFTQVKGQRTEQITTQDQDLSAMVGFAGTITGLVSVQCSNKTAAAIAAKMLFTNTSTLTDDDIRDAIGEIANMVAGGYKAKYVERIDNGELVLEQSVPTVIKGEQFETYVLGDATRHAAMFNFEEHDILIELWIRGN
jgi:chemotaxis protein CheX